ncbi:MAG: hypothetical protein V4440_14625 [Pseudomonadota bacterium]
MADKFKVGQKVRIIGSEFRKELIGSVTTITGPCVEWTNNLIDLTWHGYSVDISSSFSPKEEHLEPFYDGEYKSSWSECAWKPNTVKQPNGA